MVNPFLNVYFELEHKRKILMKERKALNGRDLKEIEKRIELLSLHKKAIHVFERTCPGMFHEPADTSDYNFLYEKFVNTFRDECSVFSHYSKGVFFIQNIIQEGNESNYWDLDIPSIPIEIGRLETPYDDEWLKKSKQCSILYQNWMASIELNTRNSNMESLFFDILLSAVFHSGIHNINTLYYFWLAISNKEKICSDEQQFWFELSNPTSITNHIDESGQHSYQYIIYLSLPTLSLIYRFYKSKKSYFYLSNDFDEFKEFFYKNIDIYNCFHLTPKDACLYSQMTAQLQYGVQYPQILSHVASQKLKSVPLCHANWLEMYQPFDASAIDLDPKLGGLKYQSSKMCRKQVNNSKFLLNIRYLIREKNNLTTKNSKKIVTKKLFELKENNEYSDPERIILGWLCECLERGNQLSTLRTYLSTAGVPWLLLCNDADIYDWSGEQFLHSYKDILNQDKCAISLISNDSNLDDINNRSNNLAAKISSIHDVAVKAFGIDPLPENLTDGVKKIPHIKAGFISEQHFKYSINALSRCDKISIHQKNMLICIAIIAYRTGMRFNEIRHLRLANVENSEEMWVYVRYTPSDDLKSLSSRRKIPLGVLLTAEEKFIVFNYFNNRFQNSLKTPAVLAFSLESDQYIPIPENQIRQLIQKALQQCSSHLNGPIWTFHHLRHTALSRMQLLIHRDLLVKSLESSLWQNLVAWPMDQCKLIYDTVMSGHARGDYWALCKFAGHHSPETTLESYLHFSDLISAVALRNGRYSWGMNAQCYFSGLSKKAFLELTTNPNEFSYDAFFQAIKNKFKPLSKTITCIHRRLQIEPVPTKQIDINAIFKILSLVERQQDLSIVKVSYGITDEYIQNLKDIANAIRNITTEKKQSRFIAKSRSDFILPGKLRSNIEQMEFEILFPKVENFFKFEPEKFKRFVKYFFLHKNTSNHAIPFSIPDELDVFLECLLRFFESNRIRVEFSKNSDVWCQYSHSSIKLTKNDKKSNVAMVWLKHPDEESVLNNYKLNNEINNSGFNLGKYSTPILSHLLFYILLIYFDADEIKSWATE